MLEANNLGLPDDIQDGISEVWQNTYESTCSELAAHGFVQQYHAAAVAFPNITPDQYSNVDTGSMAAVDYWFSRAKQLLGWVEAQLLCLEGEYKDSVRETKNAIRAENRTVARTKSAMMSETELKELAESKPYPRQLSQKIIKLQATKRILDGNIESLERFAAGLSRQVTLRGQEIDLSNRSGPPTRFVGRNRGGYP